MLRTHTCGELRIGDVNKQVTLTGWVQRSRDKGGIIWVDLRDRYGITQLILEEGKSEQAVIEQVRQLGREYVVLVEGTVSERLSKNDKIPTGDIEIWVKKITVLNVSKKLRCAFADSSRRVLCTSPVTTNIQAAVDGVGVRPVLPDRKVLP
jgi:aspartyl-tRNA synthetase